MGGVGKDGFKRVSLLQIPYTIRRVDDEGKPPNEKTLFVANIKFTTTMPQYTPHRTIIATTTLATSAHFHRPWI